MKLLSSSSRNLRPLHPVLSSETTEITIHIALHDSLAIFPSRFLIQVAYFEPVMNLPFKTKSEKDSQCLLANHMHSVSPSGNMESLLQEKRLRKNPRSLSSRNIKWSIDELKRITFLEETGLLSFLSLIRLTFWDSTFYPAWHASFSLSLFHKFCILKAC